MGLSTKLSSIRQDIRTDENLARAQQYSRRAIRSFPSAAGEYLLAKVPIVQWIPRYNPRWVLNDIVAGLTLGVMLVPQGLSYAKIATIPIQFGLMSSWLPALIYTVMGTSKDLSTGPTSIIGLLTADIVAEFTQEGYAPEVIAAATAFMIGIYSALLGFLKLGWILDFISQPVLSGFISAAALVILLGQVPSLTGQDNIGSGASATIHDFFATITEIQPLTLAVGLSGIVLLEVLAFAGRKWGKKNKVIWFLSISRAAVALTLFTGISYGLNKDREDPLFDLAKVKANGIAPPKMPDLALVQKVFTRAIAPFIAAALEHIAIGKAFAAKNNYVIDESQELCYLGVTNFFNSFFSAMGVGGAMSRTAVNSECGVRSPLSGLLTTGFVLLGIYKLTGALFWIPKATLAAIIITAVFHLIGPISKFYHFWRISLMDFVASMLAFWITLFVSAEYGIGAATAFSILYALVHMAFARVIMSSSSRASPSVSVTVPYVVPEDVKLFAFTEAILFPNADRVKSDIFVTVQTYHRGADKSEKQQKEERNWSVSGERHIARLRKRVGMDGVQLPPIRVVVLDFTAVTYVDVTAVYALRDLKAQLRKFAGPNIELRFVGVNPSVRSRFQRARWDLIDWPTIGNVQQRENTDLVFLTVAAALENLQNERVEYGEKASYVEEIEQYKEV